MARRIGSSTKNDAMKRRRMSPTIPPTIQAAVFETPMPKALIRLLFRGFSGVCPLWGTVGLSLGARSLLIRRPIGQCSCHRSELPSVAKRPGERVLTPVSDLPPLPVQRCRRGGAYPSRPVVLVLGLSGEEFLDRFDEHVRLVHEGHVAALGKDDELGARDLLVHHAGLG